MATLRFYAPFINIQVQVSVLKEEKRNLQRQVTDLNYTRSRTLEITTDSRLRSQSFTEKNSPRNTPTRDMGVMCGVMTRDVGVSHQQVN